MPIFYISVLNNTCFVLFFPQMFSYLNNNPQYVLLEHGQLSEVSLQCKHKLKKTVIYIHAQLVSQYLCYKYELSTPTCYR